MTPGVIERDSVTFDVTVVVSQMVCCVSEYYKQHMFLHINRFYNQNIKTLVVIVICKAEYVLLCV